MMFFVMFKIANNCLPSRKQYTPMGQDMWTCKLRLLLGAGGYSVIRVLDK